MKYKIFLVIFSFLSLSVSGFSAEQEELNKFLGKLSLSSSVSVSNETLFRVEDVQRSATRCCEVFNGNYDPLPIFDLTANANVGRIQYQEQGNQVLISFRGSQGLQETISNLSSNPVELFSHFNIPGNGHEALFKSYQGLRVNQQYDSPTSFFDAIRALGTLDKEERGLAGLQFTIDGHSRGAALSVYTALGLNADEELSIKPSQIRVLTYGAVDCLDHQAAQSYNQIFGLSPFKF